jgi:hypothetical protein
MKIPCFPSDLGGKKNGCRAQCNVDAPFRVPSAARFDARGNPPPATASRGA